MIEKNYSNSSQKNTFKIFIKIIDKMLINITNRINCYEGYHFLNSLKIFDPQELQNINSDILNKIQEFTLFDIENEIIKQEWDLFLHNVPPFEDKNIINYWENAMIKFPNITSFALQELRVPCSTVVVERGFSIYRKISTYQRHRFLFENLSRYVIAHFNSMNGLQIDFSSLGS